jgi:sugar phosphate permease
VAATLDTVTGPTAGARRWVILGLGWAAQTATCCFTYGIPMLVPAIRKTDHVSLARAGVVVVAPTIGLMFTLIAWGWATDHFGERRVITTGLGLAAAFLGLGCATHGLTSLSVLLGLAGAAGASVNAASGRVVIGWFAPHERGFAMGVRQTAQPIGVGLAAVTLPPLANHHLATALAFPAVLCGVVGVLVAVLVIDPPRATAASRADSPSPYRTSRMWRLHAASTTLVVPQFAVSAFTLEYLVAQRHWSVGRAGTIVFLMQFAGGIGRIAVGVWSDRVGSRLRPMRQVAAASALAMAAIAIGDLTGQWWVILAFAAGAIISVSDNGLGFTAVAELAGSRWIGRSLGMQNTAQNIAAIATPPLLGALIESSSYAWAFWLVAAFPVAAIILTPVSTRGEPEV